MESAQRFEIYYKAIKAVDGMVCELQEEALSLALDADDVDFYEQKASELKEAVLKNPPDLPHIHRLIGILTFLGNSDTLMRVEAHRLYLAGRMGPYIPQLLHYLLIYLKEEAGYGPPAPKG
jgi:hypothetical protein